MTVLNTNYIIDCIQLFRSRTIGPATYHQLIRRYGTPTEALAQVPEISNRTGGKKFTPYPRDLAVQEYESVRDFGGQTLVYGTPQYPPLLAQMNNCPPFVHSYGKQGLLHRDCIAIVGSRNASVTGQKMANELATDLGNAGYTIVSGLARGIDTSAHVGGFKTGTVAVIASGLDVVYPPENENLHEAIAKNGCLVTAHPMGSQPRSQDFPHRNTIMAGLCQATVIVESALKSGAMITARHAMDIGRDVFAIPGSPADPRSRGANQLIKDGAGLAENATDIMDSLKAGIQHTLFDHQQTNAPLNLSENVSTDTPIAPNTPPNESHNTSDNQAQLVLDALTKSPVDLDTLSRHTHLSTATLQGIILELEITGQIERHSDGRISLIS